MHRYLLAGLVLISAATGAFYQAGFSSLKGPINQIGLSNEARSVRQLWRHITGVAPTAAAAAPDPSAGAMVPAGRVQDGDRAKLLVPAIVPGSAAPDIVGAFRFICTAGPINWDDAIVYPGKIGGSPHVHQNYGNTLVNANSTHENLLDGGDSTCSNALNRSAYWVPALITGDGKNVIRPDWIGIYYKGMRSDDPSCLVVSVKGCVGIPTGLRALSGYDMKRMGEKQPENMTFHHRCTTDGKPSIHRKLLSEAVADCGGSGQIVSEVDFGNCWTGKLDSPDHRKHLAIGGYGDWGYYRCPSSHPYLIPQLAQLVVFTIEPGDGDVYFASDRMNGMNMPSGSTFHADYIEAWDLKTRETWQSHCIDKILSCSDGVLGDGTMMKRGPLSYKAVPRLMPIPLRPEQPAPPTK